LNVVAWPFVHESLPPQEIQVWLNSCFLGKTTMAPRRSEYEWQFPARMFQREENHVYLVFARSNRPSDLLPESKDQRSLAAAVERLDLAVR